MKRIISMYDNSGHWPSGWLDGGHDVICLDLKSGFDMEQISSAEFALEEFEYCDGILAAPPCTDFTVSGAQYWPTKDRDGRTAAAVELVYVALRMVNLFWPTDPDYDGSFFYAIENPVGRIHKLVKELGDPWYFDPWEYAGHLQLSDAAHNELERLRRKDGKGFCKQEVEFVQACNAYTKKTGLWGQFNKSLNRAPVEPVRVTSQGSVTQWYSGDEEGKEMRSVTPLGFAKAFYSANKDWRPPSWELPKQLSLFGNYH